MAFCQVRKTSYHVADQKGDLYLATADIYVKLTVVLNLGTILQKAA